MEPLADFASLVQRNIGALEPFRRRPRACACGGAGGPGAACGSPEARVKLVLVPQMHKREEVLKGRLEHLWGFETVDATYDPGRHEICLPSGAPLGYCWHHGSTEDPGELSVWTSEHFPGRWVVNLLPEEYSAFVACDGSSPAYSYLRAVFTNRERADLLCQDEEALMARVAANDF